MNINYNEIIKLAQELKDKCDVVNCIDCPFRIAEYGRTCDLGMIGEYGMTYNPCDWKSKYLK